MGTVIAEFMPETTTAAGDDRWLTTDEAVAYTGISRAQLLRMRQSGVLPYGRVPGGRGDLRFKRSDLDAAMRSGAEAPVNRRGRPKRTDAD